MGRYGAAILTIVGTVVGAYFGYPQLGAVLGGLAGQLLFPTQLPTVNGPRLADLTNTTSQVGTPIARGWGTFPSPGAIIAQSEIREVIQSEEVGGKGAPTQTVNTPTYYQDFAIGVNDGLIAGVRTIWANGKAVYDRRPQRASETQAEFDARMVAANKLDDEMTIYLGTESQLPDPTLEAFFGVGDISAFRGLAYVVFRNWRNKPEDGNRMPANWKFEVFTIGAVSSGQQIEYAQEVLHDWIASGYPIDARNTYVFTHESGDLGTPPAPGPVIDPILDHAVASRAWPTGVYIGGRPSNHANIDLVSDEGFEDNRSHRGFLNFTFVQPDIVHQASDPPWTCDNLPAGPGPVWYGSFFAPLGQTLDIPGSIAVPVPAPPFPPWEVATRCTDSFWMQGASEIVIKVERYPGPPPDPCTGLTPLAELPGYCLSATGDIVRGGAWTLDNSQNYHVLRLFLAQLAFPDPTIVTLKPLGPIRPIGHADDTQAFWEAAYADAVAAGTIPSGLVYGVNYPQTQAYGYSRVLDTNVIDTQQVPVSLIVSDLCKEARLTDGQINVTDLDGLFVWGYVRTRVMPARAAIEPLRQACFFDGLESERRVKFVRRGHAIAATIPDDDLGAVVSGEDTVTRVGTRKAQDVDLPRRVRIHYLSPARDYEQGEQQSPARLETAAVNDTDVELPIIMSDDQAAKIAQSLWADAWAGRWAHDIQLDAKYAELEPSDCVAIPVDGSYERARIATITDVLPVLRKLELTRDDDGAWISYAVASPPPYVPPAFGFIGPVELILLDLPALRDADDDPGFYAAVRPLLGAGFRGAGLYRSIDAGANFLLSSQFANAAPIGVIVDDVPTGPTEIWDEAGTVTVRMQNGTLESRTHDAVVAGANAAAIGADGRWEIVQFRDAELIDTDTYRVSGLLRGRRGTEHNVASTVADDRFVLLSTVGVVRIALEPSRIGASLPYRAVAVNGNLAAALTVNFAGEAEALRPFSPVAIRADRDESGSGLTIRWIRRNRLGQEMEDGAEIPMSEVSESYDVEVYDLAGGLLASATVASPEYVVALPTVPEYRVKVYQISAVVGRGHVGDAIV